MVARAEHVWVSDVQVWGDVPHPGLLVEWRQCDDGSWEGLVVWTQAFPQGRGWEVRQHWLEAAKIRRADTGPRPPEERGPAHSVDLRRLPKSVSRSRGLG